MAVTLAQAKLNTLDAIQAGVIDEFRKSSFVLDNMPFDDAVTPGTNSATLTYGYTRVSVQPTAAFRAFNAEFTPQEAQKQRLTVDLKPFGGSFQIDRVFAKVGGLIDEVAFQIQQKSKAAASLFHDTLINGDTGVDANAFDGLSKALTGTLTERYPGGVSTNAIDLSTQANMDSNKNYLLDELDEMLSLLNYKPTALLMNRSCKNKLISVARRVGYYGLSRDEFGRPVDLYNGIPIIDLGDKPGTTNPIVGTFTRGSNTNVTDIYAVYFALDGLHGVSLAGQPPVQAYLPNFDLPGAVKTGEVEMVAAIALKNSRAAGVLRNIKIA